MAKIKTYKKEIPRISTEQMVKVDRLMIEEYKIELIQMMENAGRCLAILATKKFLKKKLGSKQVIVLAGTGGNGGGALVCARRLHNWGAKVQVFLTADADRMTPVPAHQLRVLQRMGIDIHLGNELLAANEADLIIDGIIGYSVKGDPRGLAKTMIEWANRQEIPVLSLDTPSGLDLTSGTVHAPTVRADATLTLALPKQGLFEPLAIAQRGELYLGDISVPPALYQEPSLGIEVSSKLFAKADVIRIAEDEE
ncbi:MAG: NAD(P)H-hydrate epimerase [Bacteroidota bacterium]